MADEDVATTATEHAVGPDPLEKKIIRQIEFYFGDRNLCRDKFLQDKIKEEENGWVELSVLLTFSRLKALSTDCNLIIGALRKSTSGLLVVSEDGLKVKRKSTEAVPTLSLLSPETRRDMNDRTLYIKGFPKDLTLDNIQDFILAYGETEFIRMKKDAEKTFKGSIFVEFKLKECITKVLELSSELKYGDEVLSVETKLDYFKRKDAEKKQKKAENTKVEPQEEAAPPIPTEGIVRQTGAILQFKGCGGSTLREDLKEYFREYCTVAWVDFQRGDTEGYIRFDEVGGAKKALDGVLGKLNEGESPQVCGGDSSLRLLEGDEEIAYWEKMAADQMKRKKTANKRRGGGRGGRGGKRRTYGGDRDTPPSKTAKLESES